MCLHPCTNTRKKILLMDTNVLIYSKALVLRDEEKILNFWMEKCKKYCCLCEKKQFVEEFFEKEQNEKVIKFFNNLINKGLLLLKPYSPILSLERDWKLVIDELKRLKNNDEKGLARLVKLCKQLIDSGCDKRIFEFFTYDKQGAKIIYRNLNLQISNNISHDLWKITRLPPNWPDLFKEILLR